MTRGAAAQRRRRIRRATERATVAGVQNAPVVAPEGPAESLAASAVEEVETAAMSGTCANCDHTAAKHLGASNAGPCTMAECSCQGMKEEAKAKASIAELTQLVEQAFAPGDDPPGNAPEPKPETGTCTCGHSATAHDGPMNAGACMASGCTCDGFEASDENDGDQTTSVQADGATAVELPAEHTPGETLPKRRASVTVAEAPAPEPVPTSGDMKWSAVIAPEGKPTSDGRIFAPNSITWRDLPLSLGVMMDTPHADVVTASPVCGRIDKIYRQGDLLIAEGEFDNSDLGHDVARMVGDGTLRGVSVDLAVSKMEIAYQSDILDDEGNWKPEAGQSEDGEGPGLADILFGESEDKVMYVVWDGTIGAVTVCPFPAFHEAKIEVGDGLAAGASPIVWRVSQQAGWRLTFIPRDEPADDVLVAAAGTVEAEVAPPPPLKPPVEWYHDPQLDGPTPLTVDDDGRVYGHIAPWGVCHIGIPGVCTTAPTSETGYAYMHLKEVECEGGERVACGTITLGTGHADRNLGRAMAARHYDDTGAAVADIVCGEDEHGIWFTGSLRSTVSDETLRELRGASLSGDWRDVNGNLELIAALAVNVPGFPIPRARAALVASGEEVKVTTLIAAGIIDRDDPAAGTLSPADRAMFETIADLATGRYAEILARALAVEE